MEDIVVIGGGWAGYNAALLGVKHHLSVVLIEQAQLGGTCLNRGCIPSKAFIEYAQHCDAQQFKQRMTFINRYIAASERQLRDQLVSEGVRIINGTARFIDAHTVQVDDQTITFNHAIIATGSRPVALTDTPFGERIWDSDRALHVDNIPGSLIVFGAGTIGLEIGVAYSYLGTKVTIIEQQPDILAGWSVAARDCVLATCKKQHIAVHTNTTPSAVVKQHAVEVCWENTRIESDAVLVCIGRQACFEGLDCDAAGISVCDNHIVTNEHRQTSIPHIYACGDVTTGPQLAHKAYQDALCCIKHIITSPFVHQAIPEVIFTTPPLARVGSTDITTYQHTTLAMSHSPISTIHGQREGHVRVVYDQHHHIVGWEIVGYLAPDLIGTACLTLGKTLEECAHSIMAHPTMSEILVDVIRHSIRQ